MHIPCSYITELLSSLEEASIVGENETYPRALLHWNRAASQGMSIPHNSNLFLVEPLMFVFMCVMKQGRREGLHPSVQH